MIERRTILEKLAALRLEAEHYFEKVRREADKYPRGLPPGDFFQQFPARLRSEADRLAAEVVSIMEPASSLVRHSPGLTVADHHDLVVSIKQMRSAIHLRHYRYWDTEVLHDEGTVLGVQPPRQSEFEASPTEAASLFANALGNLTGIIELATEGDGTDATASSTAALGSLGRRGFRPGTAFILMAMDRNNPHLEDIRNTVKRCFDDFGIKAVRADDIEHEGLITSRVLEEIETAEFLFADLTGERPSVYYELGYAHAIHRRVILFRQEGTPIHFDVQGYNCPEYKNLAELEKQLRGRLEYITGKRETSSGARSRGINLEPSAELPSARRSERRATNRRS